MNARLGVVAAAALMILLPLDLVAAERATFVLRNGQRESGVVVAHGDQRANLINGFFNLGEMPGGTGRLQERAYPAADVVAIDFAGGDLPQQELAGLNRMNGQPNMLVLRSGGVVYGRFDNIIEGSTVSFADQLGQRQTYSARDVARIYLDAATARTLFNVQPDPVASRQPVDPGSPQNPNPRAIDRGSRRNPNLQPMDRGSRDNRDRQPIDQGGPALRVLANRPWTDTGIVVRRGDRVSFRASGQIQFGDSDRDVAGAEGNPRYRIDPYELPVRSMPIGGLIGRVGNNAPFPVGSNTNPIVMPEDGRLYLGVNEKVVSGNRGAFLVEILTERQ